MSQNLEGNYTQESNVTHPRNLWLGILLLLLPVFIQMSFSGQFEHPQLFFSCRLIQALGAALVGSYLGEYIKIKLNIPNIEAYGAIVLFVIVFLVNPPPLEAKPSSIVSEQIQNGTVPLLSPDFFEPTRTNNIKKSKSALFFRATSYHQSFANNNFRQLILNHLKKGYNIRVLVYAPLREDSEFIAKRFDKPLDKFTVDCVYGIYKVKTLIEENKGPGILEARLYDTVPEYRLEYYGSDLDSLFQRYMPHSTSRVFVRPDEIKEEYSESDRLWDNAVPLQTWLVQHPKADLSRNFSEY